MKNPTDPQNLPRSNNVAALLQIARGAERAAINRLASSLSHALGTPLNVIAGRAAMIAMTREDDAQSVDNVRIIEERVRAITQTIHEVLAFARAGKASAESQNLQQIVRRVVDLLQPLAEERGILLSARPGTSLEASVAGEAIFDVLVLLVGSGLQWGERGASIELSLTRERVDPPASERGRALLGDYARFVVSWSKIELPGECLIRVYEPWFEPVSPRAELSLDLAASYGLAREHHGWIEASLESGCGTTFIVNWPLSRL